MLPEGLAGLEKLAELVRQRCPTFPLSLPDYRTELEAALWWRSGKAYQGKDNNKALEWHEKALVRLGHEGELREATAEVCYSISNKLYKDKKHTESIPFLDRAIELKPDYPSAFNLRGIAFHYLKEYQQAIQDYSWGV